jgi:hypothetical protein
LTYAGVAEPGRLATSTREHRTREHRPPRSHSGLKTQEILMHTLPILADYIWIGGGTLGTILIIVIIVYLIRRA